MKAAAQKTSALLAALAAAGCLSATTPATASASICGAVGILSGVAGKACNVASRGGKLISAGKKLATGHVGSAVKTAFGGGGSKVSMALELAAVVAWVNVGARGALNETAKIVGQTTRPQLRSTWFSSTYWRVSAVAAVLTLPFLFAASAQAVMRSDLALLARSVFGYLPLSLLAVGIAAPLTTLLLSASDEMSAIVASAGRNGGARFLAELGRDWGAASVFSRSPFLAFLIGMLTALAAIALWVELLMREAAVYIVVLMLPLAFAAMVWPARRVWAVRSVELLVALILSKFAIVAVLALGGAALGRQGSSGAGGMLVGLVLVLLASFAPWALLRLLPLAELASGAAGHLRGELSRLRGPREEVDNLADRATGWAGSLTAGMRREARDASPEPADRVQASPASSELEKLGPAGGNRGAGEGDAAADDDGARAGNAAGGAHSAAAGNGGPLSETATDDAHGDHATTPLGTSDQTVSGRRASFEPLLSAEDLTGNPLRFDPEDGDMKQSLWPADAEARAGGDEESRQSPRGAQDAADHDLRPPAQDPGDGRL